jgi:tRNA uridine 5-carboxymethylaminomethyl modification enzyme
LRQDNADLRLTPLSFDLGLAKKERLEAVEQKATQTEQLVHFFKTQSYLPEEVNPILEKHKSALVKQSDKLNKLLSRPRMSRHDLADIPAVKNFILEQKIGEEVYEQAEIQIKYSGYIQKEMINAEKLNRLDHIKIPDDFDYDILASLSHEAKEKLNYIKPTNLSQASRISGINPSDISVLLVKLGR